MFSQASLSYSVHRGKWRGVWGGEGVHAWFQVTPSGGGGMPGPRSFPGVGMGIPLVGILELVDQGWVYWGGGGGGWGGR